MLLEAEASCPPSSEELERCANDVAYWCDTYVKTYDPRLKGEKLIPFRLFPKQREALEWIDARYRGAEAGLIEKSRDVGITWLACAWSIHKWLFEPQTAIGWGSRKLELVDKLGDPSCIFEKMRLILNHLPEWMMPAGWAPKQHDNYCKLLNPANGSTIVGEGGDEIGRGGRTGVYFIDESAFLEHPQRVEASLSATTNCRIDISTPNGMGNAFAAKRHGGQIPVLVIDWRDDPRKDQAWYDEQKRKYDAVTVAQEIDRDYSASVEGVCIPAAWVRAAVGLKLPQSAEKVAGLDVAEFGRDKNVLTIRSGPAVLSQHVWEQLNTTQSAWKAEEYASKAGVSRLHYDCIGVGAGIRGTYESAERELSFAPVAFNSSEAPSERVWPDGKTSKERFLNKRIELWWMVRTRFEKAYEFRVLGIAHPEEEMISLPEDADAELLAELSMPVYQRTESGKLKLESKQHMRDRGVKSPNRADSLVYSFDDEQPIQPFGVVVPSQNY